MEADNSFTSTTCFGGNKRKLTSHDIPSTSTNVPVKRKAPEVADENESILRVKSEKLSPENRLSKLYKFISNDKIRSTTRRGILKKTQSPNVQSSLNTPQRQDQQVSRLSDHDPSYGFASRYSDSKSYFRAHNVDTTIPNALIKRDDLLQTDIPVEGGGNFRDILFPLRASNGSNKSNCSLAEGMMHNCETPSTALKENFTNIRISSPPQKKRVKFDDSLDALYDQPTFDFQRDVIQTDNGKNVTLREKIYDFFANLF